MNAYTKKILTLLGLCAFTAPLAAQTAPAPIFTSANYYWLLSNHSIPTANGWSTDQDTQTSLTTLAYDNVNYILGVMNTNTGNPMTSIWGVRDVLIKGILYDTTSDTGTYTWYAADAAKVNLTVSDGLVNTSGKQLIMRSREGGGDLLSLTTGQIYVSNSSTTNLGTTANNCFIGSIGVTGDIVINGNSSTARSTLNFTTNSFSMTAGKNIYMENAVLMFSTGTTDSGRQGGWTSSAIDLRQNKIYASGANNEFFFGSGYTSYLSKSIQVGDIDIANETDSKTIIRMYTTDSTRSIGNIKATGAADATGSSLTFYMNGDAFEIASLTSSFATIEIQGKATIKGDFVNNYMGPGVGDLSFVLLNNNANNNLVIEGELRNDGRLRFDAYAGTNNTTVSAAGITGGTDQNTRIYTAAGVGYGTTTITLTGSGTYEYKGRLHDMAYGTTAADITSLGQGGAMNIVKSGSGTQYLYGDNYYRGETIVQAGELYMRADNVGRDTSAGVAEWGLGKLRLQGGKFGAMGNAMDVKTGKVIATELSFEGGTLVIDINGTIHDELAVGALTVANGEVMKIEVNILDFDDSVPEFKIISWTDGSITDENQLDGYLLNFVQSGYDGSLRMGTDGVYLSVVIPEPAHIAAFFGLLAIIFAARRRKS